MPALDNLVYIQGPAAKDWIIREGDNAVLQFVVKRNGTVVDMTGVTGTCKIRSDYDSGVDIASGVVSFPTPTSGTVRVVLDSTATTAVATAKPAGTSATQLQVAVGFYDVELADGTNQVTILGGQAISSREITP